MLSILFGVLLIFQASAQQPIPAQGQPPSASSASTYAVGPGDELKVTIFDEPQLSGSYKVDTDGSISYAILGRVTVGGRTVRDIETLLTKMLSDGYVNRPTVTVEVTEYRSKTIFVMGEVKTPGQYPLTGDSTLMEILAQAGSLTANASDELRVLRPRDPATVTGPALPDDSNAAAIMTVNIRDIEEGRFGSNIALQNGDTVFVPEAKRFYINGQVRSPGSFLLAREMTVEQAIAVAGGLTERGSRRGIKIRREIKPGQFKEFDVRMTDKVQPGDTIIVRQRRI